MDVSYGSINTPIGTFWTAAGERGIVRAGLEDDGGAFVRLLMTDGYMPSHDPGVLTSALRQVEEYFNGDRVVFDVLLDLHCLTPFQQAVLRAVAAIPYGETRSYRDIAETVGKPLAARAVGGAVAENPISLFVPCHRVVKSDGSVGFYARDHVPDRGVARKLELLALEGVKLARVLPHSR